MQHACATRYMGAGAVRVDDDDVPTQHLLYLSLNTHDHHVQIEHVRYATKRGQVLKTEIWPHVHEV